MKGGMLIFMLVSLSLGGLTQSTQKSGASSSPNLTQTQIVELPVVRRTEPLILFDLAVKDEKGECKVHHHPLKVATIPVIYGLLPGISKEAYSQAEAAEFPNAITRHEAGCLVMEAKEAKVLQCQKCLQAKKVWLSHQSGILGPTVSPRMKRSRLRFQ